MPNIKNKGFTSFLLLIVFLFSVLLGWKNVQATVITASTSNEVIASGLNPPQQWTLSISGTSVSARISDTEAVDGTKTLLYIKDLQLREGGEIRDGKSELNLNVGDLSDGLYGLRLCEARKEDPFGSTYSLGDYRLKIENGIATFYFPGGTSEKAFYKSIAKYDPSDYDEMPDFASKMEHLEEITKLAKELTAGCNSNEEKVRAIHDWICKNIAYDRVSKNTGDTSKAADPDHVFETHLAVCSGYSRLARILLGAIGIPCLNINGYADYDGLMEGSEYGTDETNHEWNCVYINNKWNIIDHTADSINKYYDASSKIGQPARYNYYGISPEQISVNHCSIKVIGFVDSKTEGVSLDKTSAIMNVGDKLTLTATVTAKDRTVTWKSSNDSVATVKHGVVTAKGAGEATITATAKASGKTATCNVSVRNNATEPNNVSGAKDAYTGISETIKITANGTAAVTSVTSNGGNKLTISGSVNQNGVTYAVSRFAENSFSQVGCKRIVIDLKASGNTQRVKIMQRAFKGCGANRLTFKLLSSGQIKFKNGALTESLIKKILIYGLDETEFEKVENNLRISGFSGEIVMK